MVRDDEARFIQACSAAAEYPKNVVCHNIYDYLLVAYTEHLDEQENRLFCDELKAVVHMRQYDEAKKGVHINLASPKILEAVNQKPDNSLVAFESLCARSLPDLQDHLVGQNILDRRDPKCRFV